MKFSNFFPRSMRTPLIIVLALGIRLVSAADFQLISAGFGVSDSANGDSGDPIVSADGRYILFSSSANNLILTNSAGPVPATKPRWQNVFLRDRVSGSNILISLNRVGNGGDFHSWPGDISTNGQFILFESSANDLVAGDNNNADDIFIRDVVNGTTTLVSVNTNGLSGNGNSHASALTPDGRFVVFVSAAADLVPNDTNGISDIFVRDLQFGTTTRLSPGAIATGLSALPSTSESPVITPD
jgi:Tol biopolymer transport system component